MSSSICVGYKTKEIMLLGVKILGVEDFAVHYLQIIHLILNSVSRTIILKAMIVLGT